VPHLSPSVIRLRPMPRLNQHHLTPLCVVTHMNGGALYTHGNAEQQVQHEYQVIFSTCLIDRTNLATFSIASCTS
jgi:hypothetical protein